MEENSYPGKANGLKSFEKDNKIGPIQVHDDDENRDIESGVGENSHHLPPGAPTSDIGPLPIATEQVLRSKSRSSSLHSRPRFIIPRSKRRGLLAKFTIIPEIERPVEYKRNTKWLITFFVALASAAAPMGSAVFYPALAELSADLNSTQTVVNLSIATFILSMAIFPLWWSSFSETLGRRTIYIVSFVLFVVFSILSAVSTNIGMLIVMRILGGGAAASVQAVGAGTVADVWEPKERGNAMGIFYLGPLMGPFLAPIIGGALSQAYGWRSTMWFLSIYGGVIVILIIFFLPETLAITKPVVQTLPSNSDGKVLWPDLTHTSTKQSGQKRAISMAKIFKRCIIDPLYVLTYLRFPAVAITVYYASITFSCVYISNISIEQTFSQSPYSFSIDIVGLLYIPTSLGYLIGSLFGGRWSDKIMHREARAAGRYDENGKLLLQPEDRMRENAYLAAIIYPGALLWYGWSVQYHKHWVIACVANFFFGIGSMMIFGMAATMLTEFMPKRSASAIAVSNFVRNIFGCVGGIIASPLVDAVGNGWLFTGLAIICWLSMAIIWAMRRFGPGWRAKMDVALGGYHERRDAI